MGQISSSSLRLSDGTSVKFEYHDSLSSTSFLAKEYAEKGYPDKYVIERKISLLGRRTDVRIVSIKTSVFTARKDCTWKSVERILTG